MTDKYTLEELQEGLCYNPNYNIIIPKRYSDVIVGHVISNYLSRNPYFSPPLYLAVKGDPGEGKTFQAIMACNQRGIMVKYLSSSKLSGEMEGASRDVIERIYNQAAQLKAVGKYVCILLDDFHLGNSSVKGDASRTINAELLVGYMMNLAEHSNQNRIPIILTGNDFSGTYDALLRDGRADIFTWEPTLSEKQEIVQSILNPVIKPRDAAKLPRFVERYSDQNVAFFAQLRNDMRKQIVAKSLESLTFIDSSMLELIDKRVARGFNQIDLETLDKLAADRLESRRNGGLF